MEETMAMYISTPYGRWMGRRRMMNRWLDENVAEEPRNRVFFPMDVKADEDGYVISALLPGVIADDLNITIANDTLTIQGDLKNEYEEDATYVMQERPSGRFFRAINLPEPVDSAKVEASLTNGVLTLRIPKAEEAKPKMIKVINK
jgi:HSP20 family protein